MKELVVFFRDRTETFRMLIFQAFKLWKQAGFPEIDDIEVSIRKAEKKK